MSCSDQRLKQSEFSHSPPVSAITARFAANQRANNLLSLIIHIIVNDKEKCLKKDNILKFRSSLFKGTSRALPTGACRVQGQRSHLPVRSVLRLRRGLRWRPAPLLAEGRLQPFAWGEFQNSPVDCFERGRHRRLCLWQTLWQKASPKTQKLVF